jgi:haloalkane dehalogenase
MTRRFYVDLPHGQMHGRIADHAGGPWVVLLHQSPSSSAMYDALIPHLAADFNVIAPDNPGFGNSDAMTEATMDDFARAIAGVLADFGVQTCHVFGHHTGAAIGVSLATLFPELVTKIALCGPPVLTNQARLSLPNMAPIEEMRGDGSHLMAMWARLRAKEVNAPPAISTRELGLAFSASAHTKSAYQAVASQDFTAQLEALSQPVLMFAGERDSLFSALPAAAAARPNDLCITLEDAGGYVCELKPDVVAGLLTPFFLGGGHGS